MKLWKPEVFQGTGKRTRYFEGWYFRMTDGGASGTWACIPGISLGPVPGSGYSFIQIIGGENSRTWWFEFPLKDFRASVDHLEIQIGKNRFSSDGIHLDIDDGKDRFKADLQHSPFHPITTPFWSPGVMGPFSFIPFMECRHGLVSLDHEVSGSIQSPEGTTRFNKARGYAEKDWGASMPSAWIWTQANCFQEKGNSIMLSIARIPWLGSWFTGFICVGTLGGIQFLHTTYTGSAITELHVEERTVLCRIRKKGQLLTIRMEGGRKGDLRAPVQGALSRRIAESGDASLTVKLEEQSAGPGRVHTTIFEGISRCAGLETAGEMAHLVAWKSSPGKQSG